MAPSNTVEPGHNGRRTQAARRAETQGKLLHAAVESLVERGYAHASVADICRRAGLSQGALFQYHPTKLDLLVDAARHMYDGLRARYRIAFQHLTPGEDAYRAAVRLLWETFQQPELVASYELHIAARTDDDLRAALRPILDAHTEGIYAIAREVFPERAATDPQFDRTVGVIVSAMQGAAISAFIRGIVQETDAFLDYLEWLAREAGVPAEATR